MPSLETAILRIILAVGIGALIGLEREYRNKSAGFRTMILICMGSCLFTLVSAFIGMGTVDRIASNIVTGIGFLGAGVIFQNENKVNGLTTAATIWVTAALGMCAAAGFYMLAATGCGIVMVILLSLTMFEKWMDKMKMIHMYKIMFLYRKDPAHDFEKLFERFDLKYKHLKHNRTKNIFTAEYTATGKQTDHKKFIAMMLEDSEVLEFHY